MKHLLQMLGFAKRRSWQELVGDRPHMIDPEQADGGFGKRKSYEVVDGVALIDARGVLINDEDYWDGYGCSTYDRIAGEIRGAAEDPAVKGIILRLNTPGGECDNAFECASAAAAAGKQKPLWSVAETSAYSAGYLLASSGSRIYVPPYTGGVGSIGVYSVHMDMSGYLDQLGIKATFVEAGKGKTEGHPYKPLSDAGKKKMQGEIDRLYGLFVDHVAAQRNMTAGAIHEMGAALKHGQGAIDAGLADKIGNTGKALADMREFLAARAAKVSMSGMVEAPAAPAAEDPVPVDVAEAPEVPVGDDIAAEVDPNAVPRVEEPAQPAAEEPDPVVAARESAERDERITALIVNVAGLPPARIKDFAGLTPEQVGERLLAERAAASEQQPIVSQLQPHTGASAGTANVNESAIVKAAEKLAQAGKGR